MKITVDRKTFLAACQLAALAAASRDIKPILKGLKLAAKDDGLTITATDMEIGVRLCTPATVHEPGAVVLPADRLTAILKESGDVEAFIATSGDTASVTSGSAKFEMPTDDADNFPDLPSTPSAWCALRGEDARTLIRRTSFAVASGDAKFSATTGVHVEYGGNVVRAVATNGRRMAIQDVPASGAEFKPGVLPAKALALVEKLIAADDVRLCVGSNEAFFQTGAATVYTRLVDGRFPAWQSVVPPDVQPVNVTVAVGDLTRVLRQAGIMTSDESRGVRLTIAPNQIDARAQSQSGTSAASCRCDGVSPGLEVILDPWLVLDMLRTFGADEVLTLQARRAEKPVLLRTKDGAYRFIVVPLAGRQQTP